MKMYYVTRYEHNPNRQTEYYFGGGHFYPMSPPVNASNNMRISLRLYANVGLAKVLCKTYTETDWHEVDICL